MKKTILVIVVLSFVLINYLPAQIIGVKGGANFGKFVGEDVDDLLGEGFDEKYNIGYQGGIFFAIPVDPLDIRIEALYEQNGGKFEGEEEGIEASYVIQLNWVDIPVLIGVKAGPIRIFAGPYFDFFLGGKMKFEISYGGESFDEEEDIESDELQSFNYGVIAGAAIGLGGGMEIEIRYSQGMNTIDKEPDDWDDTWGEYEEIDFKPSMLQASLNIPLTRPKT